MIYFDECPYCNSAILALDYKDYATCPGCKRLLKVFVNEDNDKYAN